MDFYNDLVTEKSWQALQTLKGTNDFILIGGWAVYLYTKSLKSKDIDIIVNYDELAKLKADFGITKNERLKKYEARRDEIQIDIYLPYYSNLGIPVEEIVKNTGKIELFKLPVPELLLILKQYTYGERKLTPKGEKDRLDILSIITKMDLDWKLYQTLIKKYKLQHFASDLSLLLRNTVKIPELGMKPPRPPLRFRRGILLSEGFMPPQPTPLRPD